MAISEKAAREIIDRIVPGYDLNKISGVISSFKKYAMTEAEESESELAEMLEQKLKKFYLAINPAAKSLVNTVKPKAKPSPYDIEYYKELFTPCYNYEKYSAVYNSFAKSLRDFKDTDEDPLASVNIKYLENCLEVALRHKQVFDGSKGLCIMPRGKTVFPYTTVALQKSLVRGQTGATPQAKILSNNEVKFIHEKAAKGDDSYSLNVYADPAKCLPFHAIESNTKLSDANTVIVWLVTDDGRPLNAKTYSAKEVMDRVGVKIENGVVMKRSVQGSWFPDKKSVWVSRRSGTDPLEMLKSKAFSWYLKDYNTLDSECEAMEQKTFEQECVS